MTSNEGLPFGVGGFACHCTNTFVLRANTSLNSFKNLATALSASARPAANPRQRRRSRWLGFNLREADGTLTVTTNPPLETRKKPNLRLKKNQTRTPPRRWRQKPRPRPPQPQKTRQPERALASALSNSLINNKTQCIKTGSLKT